MENELKKMNIELTLHSVLLLVGPTNCGKTSFVKNIIIPQIENFDLINYGYISSDDIRRELLGKNYNKYDQRMTHVSSITFKEIYSRLTSYTKFPVKKELIIVDTTGLSEDFRKDIKKICDENHYKLDVLLFAYKNKEDNMLFSNEELIKKYNINKIIWRHLDNLKLFYKNMKIIFHSG